MPPPQNGSYAAKWNYFRRPQEHCQQVMLGNEMPIFETTCVISSFRTGLNRLGAVILQENMHSLSALASSALETRAHHDCRSNRAKNDNGELHNPETSHAKALMSSLLEYQNLLRSCCSCVCPAAIKTVYKPIFRLSCVINISFSHSQPDL